MTDTRKNIHLGGIVFVSMFGGLLIIIMLGALATDYENCKLEGNYKLLLACQEKTISERIEMRNGNLLMTGGVFSIPLILTVISWWNQLRKLKDKPVEIEPPQTKESKELEKRLRNMFFIMIGVIIIPVIIITLYPDEFYNIMTKGLMNIFGVNND